MSDRRLLRAALATLGIVFALLVVSVSSASAASAPSVDGQWVSDVGYTLATLHAKIDPREAETTYHFEYGPTTSYGANIPASYASVGAGSEDVQVSQVASGLQAGLTYHYRIVASNPEGATDGPDLVLKTHFIPVNVPNTCSNALIRQAQFASYLPDCRAYELVSPPGNGKGGANIASEQTKTQAAVDGDAIKYYSTTAFGDAQGIETLGAEYVSQRELDGSHWVTHGINPAQASRPIQNFYGSHYEAFSEDLSNGVYYALSPVTGGHPNVEGVDNLYLRTDVLSAPPGTYELLSDSVNALPASNPLSQKAATQFVAASSDWTHVLLESTNDLTSEAEGLSTRQPKLYEWHEGALTLAGILPSEQPASASIASGGIGGIGEGPSWPTHAISADGARVVFTVPVTGVAGNIYMRINGKKTMQLNISERTDCAEHNPCQGTPEPDPNGEQPAEYAASTPDDMKVFFLTKQALTDNAVVDAGERKLYMYDLTATAGKHLTLISVDEEPAHAHEGADLADGVAAVSNSGEYVYFTGPTPLLAGQSGGNRQDALYVWHDGALRTIAQAYNDGQMAFFNVAWGNDGIRKKNTVRISEDGKTAVFLDSNPETAQSLGFDSVSAGCQGRCKAGYGELVCAEPGEACREVYVYSYETGELRCASCDISGARPVSDASFNLGIGEQSDAIAVSASFTTAYLNRPLSYNSRYVFFDTGDALVPDDTNGRRDVYEYDIQTGFVNLISSGTCNCDSRFVDASANGSNVFFTTRQQLVHADIDGSADMYDARIEGGIAGQNQPPRPECSSEECQGPAPSPPTFSLPSSSTFSGMGNLPQTVVPVVRSRSGGVNRAQRLTKALRACRKKRGKRRAKCEAHARKIYAASKSVKRAPRRNGR